MPFRGNPTRSDRIDGDAKRSQFVGHAPTPTDLPTLGSDVGAELRDGAMKDFACDVNDSTVSPSFHTRQNGLGQMKRAHHEEFIHRTIKVGIVLLNGLLGLVGSGVGN